MDYEKATVDEREEYHAFEVRRHEEALRHLQGARRVSNYGIDTTPMVAAASKCNSFAFEDFLKHKDRVGGEELHRIDVAVLDQQMADEAAAAEAAASQIETPQEVAQP